MKEYDKAIEKQLQAIPQTLASIKGIGNVYAAGIIAEIGDINRFSGQASLVKYAGLVWSQHQSSTFDAEDKHMIHGGNHHLKYYLCEAANSLRRCDPEFKRLGEGHHSCCQGIFLYPLGTPSPNLCKPLK